MVTDLFPHVHDGSFWRHPKTPSFHHPSRSPRVRPYSLLTVRVTGHLVTYNRFLKVSSFIKLLTAISSVTRRAAATKTTKCLTPLDHVSHWLSSLKHLDQSLPVGTWGAFFRLLFPDQDIRRRYGMRDDIMLSALKKCLGLRSEDFERWDKRFSCLGAAVHAALERTASPQVTSLHILCAWLSS